MPIKNKNQKSSAQKIVLPDSAQKILFCDFGSSVNLSLAKDFDLTIGQTAKMTRIIADLFYEQESIISLEVKLVNELAIAKDKARKLAMEICGKRLLAADEEWFNGAVVKKIEELGGAPEEYKEIAGKYADEIKKEEAALEMAKKEDEEAEKIAREAKKLKERKVELAPPSEWKPEEEKRAGIKVFSEMVLNILNTKDYALKIELNSRIIRLLIEDDDSHAFLRTLLDTLHNNKELVSQNKIIVGGEKAEPTVANWLKDYLLFVGAEEAASSLKKAQYFSDAPNVKGLAAEEKATIERLLKLFNSLNNFYLDVERKELEDLEIFPFTLEDENAINAALKKYNEESAAGESVEEEKSAEPVDIAQLYADKEEDRIKIDAEKSRLEKETRREIDKVANQLEELLLHRKKHGIIASLKILAEIGGLDNLLASDKRYQDLILGYFKRNNLSGEEKKFKADPHAGRYLQLFLKFVFLERLGMSESEGARQALKLAEIFLEKGLAEYGQLAYLDLADNKFKWSEI